MDQFLGQMCVVAFNFAPRGWMPCQGQQLSIPQYTALFSLIGTTYGGDGVRTFALPNISEAPGGHGKWIICVQGNFPSRP